MTQINIYSKCNVPEEDVKIDIGEVFKLITSDKFKKDAEYLRQEKDENKRRAYKQQNLPAITFGGTFTKRTKVGLEQASGLATLDVDDYTINANELKNKLSGDKYVFAAITSPSGGMKIIVRIPIVKNDDEYKVVYAQLLEYFKQYNPAHDEGCKDICRLMFLTYDPELYINYEAKEFPVKWDIAPLQTFTINNTNTDIPKYCPVIEEQISKREVKSGSITRHGNLDGQVYIYAKNNNRPQIIDDYKKANGRNDSAFNGSDNYSWGCNPITRWAEENDKVCFDICKKCKFRVGFRFQEFQKKSIELPCGDRLISQFADDVGDVVKDIEIFFYKPEEKNVVEIRKIPLKNKDENEKVLGFCIVSPYRFVSLIEKFITPFETKKTKYGEVEISKSMNANHAKLVIESPQFQDKLPRIKRIFNIPIPILYDGKLTFPKKGYDERFESWLPHDSIDINPNLTCEEAKDILFKVYNEFCFDSEEDSIHAVAALLTPFLRGLYQNFNDRTPIFFYIANRERAGKDYCANITGIVYDGVAIEEPPISNSDDFNSNSNDELRKKILSVLISGRKRLHFSNNKGFINNAILEQIATNKVYSDRLLGGNEMLNFDNELEISLSGNMGVTFTADLANRCRFIRLKLLVEDPNSRKFNNPHLHDWIMNNRQMIISALYAFVRDWFEKGMPDGQTLFSSFPEWARVCGGIMNVNGLGDPCSMNKEVLVIGGDAETESMKKLYNFMFEHYKNKPYKKKEIIELISENGLQGEGVLSYLDFTKNADKTKFGILIEKFLGRILSGVVLKCIDDANKTSCYKRYVFCEYVINVDDKVINLDNLINLRYPRNDLKKIYNYSSTNVNKVDKVDNDGQTQDIVENPTKPQPIVVIEELLDLIKPDFDVPTQTLIDYFGNEAEKQIFENLEILKKRGEIFESKPDHYRRL